MSKLFNALVVVDDFFGLYEVNRPDPRCPVPSEAAYDALDDSKLVTLINEVKADPTLKEVWERSNQEGSIVYLDYQLNDDQVRTMLKMYEEGAHLYLTAAKNSHDSSIVDLTREVLEGFRDEKIVDETVQTLKQANYPKLAQLLK